MLIRIYLLLIVLLNTACDQSMESTAQESKTTEPAPLIETTNNQEDLPLSITDKFPGFNILDNIINQTPLTNVPNTGTVYCTVCTTNLSINSFRLLITNNFDQNVLNLTLVSAFIIIEATDNSYSLYRKLATNNRLSSNFEFQVAEGEYFDMSFLTIFQDSNGEYMIYKDTIPTLEVSGITYKTVNQSLYATAADLNVVYLTDLL